LEKAKFTVDNDTIYDIFAHKLDTTAQNLKEGKNIVIKGKIGF